MKLRSGIPVWLDNATPTLQFSPLAHDAQCDVLVLGGGITGALVSFYLAKSGVKVLLLDRREIGRGSTAASTGLLQYEVDTPLVELIKKVGQAQAVHAYRRGLTAIDEIEQLLTELGTPCGFARRQSLYFATHFWHARQLKREYECRRQSGLEVEFLNRRQLSNISSLAAAGAILSRGDAQINPLRFTQQLIAAAIRYGLVIHENTEVVDIDEHPRGVTVHTPNGRVQAKAIMYATGYESKSHLDDPKGNLNSTYAIASQCQLRVPGWPEECLIWETARPYFYARYSEDGRAIIGGEDTEFSDDHRRDGLLERKTQKLLKRFHKLFPSAQFTPEYAWAGTFGETKDGLAYIGQPSNRPRAYFALGYGGNGITFSMIAARLLCDLFLGRPNPDAELFRFSR